MKNWRTTFSGICAAIMAALAAIAALPYTLGDVALIIAPEWKARVTMASIIAALILRIIQSVTSADAKPPPPSDAP